MRSIRELFRIGAGPSSSHTMAPRRAAELFLEQHPNASRFRVTLYGSLAATGRGHLTDAVIGDALRPHPVEIVWKPDERLPLHPNGMGFEALSDTGDVLGTWETYSVGGGALLDDADGQPSGDEPSGKVYPLNRMAEIMARCEETGESFWEFVERCEGADVWQYLDDVWAAMCDAVERGLHTEGALPGGLGISRKARALHRKASVFGERLRQDALLAAFAYAVSEENASGGRIVTAPTCGASGVVPSVLRYMEMTVDCERTDLLHALATAGLIGNIVKQNGSISGAEVGCQGEVGTACAMAAGAATQLLGGTIRQIEYAAEMGLEHHLGLTCDPVDGLVQIPCIERNAHAAARALSCCNFALLSDGFHKISFDEVVSVILETGRALPSLYKETAAGGLAQIYRNRSRPSSPNPASSS